MREVRRPNPPSCVVCLGEAVGGSGPGWKGRRWASLFSSDGPNHLDRKLYFFFGGIQMGGAEFYGKIWRTPPTNNGRFDLSSVNWRVRLLSRVREPVRGFPILLYWFQSGGGMSHIRRRWTRAVEMLKPAPCAPPARSATGVCPSPASSADAAHPSTATAVAPKASATVGNVRRISLTPRARVPHKGHHRRHHALPSPPSRPPWFRRKPTSSAPQTPTRCHGPPIRAHRSIPARFRNRGWAGEVLIGPIYPVARGASPTTVSLAMPSSVGSACRGGDETGGRDSGRYANGQFTPWRFLPGDYLPRMPLPWGPTGSCRAPDTNGACGDQATRQ